MSSTAVNSAPAVSTIPTWIVILLSFLPLQPFHRKSSLLYGDLNISQWSVVKGLSEALSAITCPLLVVEPKCQWWLMRNWAAITWIFFSFFFFLISHSWFWPVLSSWGWQARRWNANLRDACEQCWSLSHCHSIYCTVSHGSAWVRGNSIWGMGPDFGALNVSFANTPQTAAL